MIINLNIAALIIAIESECKC